MIEQYIPRGLYEWYDKNNMYNVHLLARNYYFVTGYGWVTESQLNYLFFG